MTSRPAALVRMSRRTLRRLTTAILAAGFSSAVVIYFVAGPAPENPFGYEPLQNKRYLHDLELYGGKANVLAAEFREWFVSLWQGRQLALTVIILTVAIVLTVRYLATPLPDEPAPSSQRTGRPRGAYPRALETPKPPKDREQG